MHLRVNEPVAELDQAYVLAQVLEERFKEDPAIRCHVLLGQFNHFENLTVKRRVLQSTIYCICTEFAKI